MQIQTELAIKNVNTMISLILNYEYISKMRIPIFLRVRIWQTLLLCERKEKKKHTHLPLEKPHLEHENVIELLSYESENAFEQ